MNEIVYPQIRPTPLPPDPRTWWRTPDCSSSPHVRRVYTYMRWYTARRGSA